MAESYEIGPNSTPQSRLVLHAQIRLCTRVSYLALQTHLKAPHMHAASVNMNSFHPHCIAYLVPNPSLSTIVRGFHATLRWFLLPTPSVFVFVLVPTVVIVGSISIRACNTSLAWAPPLPAFSSLLSPCLSTRFLFDPLRRMLSS